MYSDPAAQLAAIPFGPSEPSRISHMRVAASTQIACPPEKVFDMLADLRNDAIWNSRTSSAELKSTEPITLGSRFTIVNGGSAYDVTITTHARPDRLVLEARGKP